jgi:hypothetical protein
MVLVVGATGCGTNAASSGPSRKVDPFAPTTAAPSPALSAGRVATVVRDAIARGWAHVTVTSTLSAANGGTKASFVDVSGPTLGTQAITVGSLTGSIVLVGRIAYVMGDTNALIGIFDIPADAAASLANQWVEVAPGDPEYAAIAVGVTLRSVLQASGPTAPVTARDTTLGGRAVVALSGGLPAAAELGSGRATLYATKGAAPLPVEFTASGADGRETEVFSQLGVPGTVRAPAHPVKLPEIPGSNGGSTLSSTVRPVASPVPG